MAIVEASEIGGVSLQDQTHVGTERLRLNGVGVRSKFFVRVYVAGLYLTGPAASGAAAIGPDAPKRVLMHLLRDERRSQLADAWREGFGANTEPAAYLGLSQRITQLVELVGDVAEGDEILLDYLPDRGALSR